MNSRFPLSGFGKAMAAVVTVAGLVSSPLLSAKEKQLNIYNWSDYIAEETIANFEQETGIKVRYDVFDSNEVLEAKLLSGEPAMTLWFQRLHLWRARLLRVYLRPWTKVNCRTGKNLDDQLMSRLEVYDQGNKHAFPYLWGTTGIGYNPELVKKHLGEDAPLDSWDLIFDEKNISKLKDCGVAVLDAPTEIVPAALNYLGLDPNSTNKKDYAKAEALLQKVRSGITYFHSSKYISDLANGDICVAVGWSGDVLAGG